MKTAKKKKKNHNKTTDCTSLFGYYVQAAAVAARMGIGLDYAFRQYVKPHMKDDCDVIPFTQEEYRTLFWKEFESQS